MSDEEENPMKNKSYLFIHNADSLIADVFMERFEDMWAKAKPIEEAPEEE